MKKQRKLSEARLVELVSEFLSEEGFNIRHEVPNMGQSTDIVATRNGWVFSIEAKIGNWRRAIEQCKAHEIVADYICIALDKNPNSPELMVALEERGYGLLAKSSESNVDWILRPARNKKIWKPQRKVFIETMKDICYAC